MWYQRLQHARYQRRIKGNALARCWAKPSPSARQPWLDTEFLAIDTETSALDPTSGELLSIGWVAIQQGSVTLRSAEHHLFQNQGGVGQSATIHQLRDCELMKGLPHEVVLERFLQAAAGRYLIFHFAHLDMGFLNQISRKVYGAPLLLPCIDTLHIEHQKMKRKDKTPQRDSLRLATCRKRYHLPDYPAHNALSDALATAELFIAQARYHSEDSDLRIKDIG